VTRIRRLGVSLASIVLPGVVWTVVAWGTGDRTILPFPADVARIFWRELVAGEIWFDLSATLARVGTAFVLAMCVGSALGILAGRKPGFDTWADAWIIIFLNLPVLVVIVLSYLWIGLTEAAAITAVAINKIPMITVMMREGARALDDMAKSFEIPRLITWRHVIALNWRCILPRPRAPVWR
jgi:NitT/TauT family transport system permease protein